MGRIKLGLQLYSIRREFASDPASTLRAVRKMGYEGVEFAGPPNLTGRELRDLLDDNGLECCGWHTPFDAVQPDRLASTVALNREVGNRFVIVPGLPADKTHTRADWRGMADFFSGLAKSLAREGMATGYHNHTREFAPLEGEAAWDTLFGNADRRVVAQLDTGNALCGGGDCVALLKRYPGQGVTVHLKPFRTPPAGGTAAEGYRPLIGDDSLPWGEIFRVCQETAGTEWFIVEYESDAYPPMEAVALNLQRLRQLAGDVCGE